MGRRKDSSIVSPQPGRKESGVSRSKPRAAFDVWLDRGLHSMFDQVANEPVPEELLRLIEGDREADREAVRKVDRKKK
jgi:hypothetical protein